LSSTRTSPLNRLLDEARAYGPEYRDGLSSHLPMALIALARLGADARRLRAFAAHYVHAKSLPPAPAREDWPAGDAWQGRFGDITAWSAYRSLFSTWMAYEGVVAVLEQALPPLLRGCGGAAFHGLIRTAYALQARHADELADALAYWACRWMDLGEPGPAGAAGDPWAILKTLALPASREPLIAQRMQAAARRRGFAAAADRLRIDDRTLARIARLAARLYARSGNFTLLHLVTSAHALRVLLPFVPDPRMAVAAYWRAAVAGVVASRLDLAAIDRAPAPRPWSELAAAAIASDDDHLIKLVDACREEQQAYGGAPDWQRAATRVVQQGRA
jgi:Questin oxidase-like